MKVTKQETLSVDKTALEKDAIYHTQREVIAWLQNIKGQTDSC